MLALHGAICQLFSYSREHVTVAVTCLNTLLLFIASANNGKSVNNEKNVKATTLYSSGHCFKIKTKQKLLFEWFPHCIAIDEQQLKHLCFDITTNQSNPETTTETNTTTVNTP